MKHLFNTDLSNILNFSILFLTKTNEKYKIPPKKLKYLMQMCWFDK